MKSQLANHRHHLPNCLSKENLENVTKFLKAKKQAALDIDPETAKVFWDYRYMHDPYGIVAGPV